MHKLYVLIVLIFVIKIAPGDADSDSNEKNVIFGDRSSTPTIEQRLDSLEDSVKALVKEVAKIATIIGSQKSAVNNINAYPQNCREATKVARFSGVYTIQVEKYGSEPFEVFCEQELYGGDWTVVARRVDEFVNFENRNWTEYKLGFGNLNGDFFIGMDKLYALTNGQQSQELIILMEDSSFVSKYAKYSTFAIGDESEGYFIKALGDYSGDAGDSLSYHRNQTFKTKDRDTSTGNCTKYGAWWYDDCYESNLFGSYIREAVDDKSQGITVDDKSQGIIWKQFRSFSLDYIYMIIRSKST